MKKILNLKKTLPFILKKNKIRVQQLKTLDIKLSCPHTHICVHAPVHVYMHACACVQTYTQTELKKKKSKNELSREAVRGTDQAGRHKFTVVSSCPTMCVPQVF